ncbi:MAG: hypothetical protein U0270_33375 [Labilithrix sp.]
MRHVLPLLVVAGTLTVIACSSDETKSPGGSGTIAPLGDGGGGDSGDDNSGLNEDCSGAAGLDCTKQTAHAKEAGCKKFDEARFKKDCESQNCGTPLSCEKQQKDLNDCLLKEPVACKSDNVDTDVPAACDGVNKALFTCLTDL